MTEPSRRSGPHLELVSIDGDPTPEERDAVEKALRDAIEAERRATSSSLWLRSGRAYGRRLGMYDYRDRFSSADAWRLSVRFPAGGREYPGLNGRGDAK